MSASLVILNRMIPRCNSLRDCGHQRPDVCASRRALSAGDGKTHDTLSVSWLPLFLHQGFDFVDEDARIINRLFGGNGGRYPFHLKKDGAGSGNGTRASHEAAGRTLRIPWQFKKEYLTVVPPLSSSSRKFHDRWLLMGLILSPRRVPGSRRHIKICNLETEMSNPGPGMDNSAHRWDSNTRAEGTTQKVKCQIELLPNCMQLSGGEGRGEHAWSSPAAAGPTPQESSWLRLLLPHQRLDFGDEDVGIVDGFFQVAAGSGRGEQALTISLHGMGGGEQNGK